MSILARSTGAPSANSAASCAQQGSRFSATVRVLYGDALPGIVVLPRPARSVPPFASQCTLFLFRLGVQRSRTAARSSSLAILATVPIEPNQARSCWIASTYAMSSLNGFVSSNRKWHMPPNSQRRRMLRQIDFAVADVQKKTLGSGGKRVITGRPNCPS